MSVPTMRALPPSRVTRASMSATLRPTEHTGAHG